jgi:cytochrome c biogenesis protein CcmG/thiol:disulfide interchange protein DsbE
MSRSLVFSGSIILIILMAILAFGLTRDPSVLQSPLVGEPLPDFKLPLLDDDTIYSSKGDISAKPALINVWASWCLPCRQEHPFLVEVANNYDIDIYGLNYKDNREDAIMHLAQFGNPYQLDWFDANGRTAIEWGVYGVPETFVLDSERRVIYRHVGLLTPEDFEKDIWPRLQ